MNQAKKSPGLSTWEIKETGTLNNRLTVRSLCGNLEIAKLQDKHILAHKPTYLAIASQMHCEISPRFVADHQESRPIFVLPRVDNGPTPDRHDRHNRNGDGWNNEYMTSRRAKADVWKVGKVTNKFNGR